MRNIVLSSIINHVDFKNKRTYRLILNILLVILVTAGIISQAFSGAFGHGGITFLYFTTESNLVMAVVSLVLLYFDLRKKELPVFLKVFHHIAVVAVTLTYLVFAFILAPFFEMPTYFYSFQNIVLHNLGPILAIIVYLLYEHETPKIARLLSIVSPLSYLGATFILYFAGVFFPPNGLPYFFLEYMTYGWLRIDYPNFGVIYWWVLIILIVFVISASIYYLKRKAQNNNKVIYITSGVLLGLSILFIILNAFVF